MHLLVRKNRSLPSCAEVYTCLDTWHTLQNVPSWRWQWASEGLLHPDSLPNPPESQEQAFSWLTKELKCAWKLGNPLEGVLELADAHLPALQRWWLRARKLSICKTFSNEESNLNNQQQISLSCPPKKLMIQKILSYQAKAEQGKLSRKGEGRRGVD